MNNELRQKLLYLKKLDLELREKLAKSGHLYGGYNSHMEKLHKKNAKVLQTIVDQYGWPDTSLVGEDGAKAAWLVLQHAISEPETQRSLLPILEKAAQEGKIPQTQVAYLTDRIRMFEGKPQIYGTQYDWDEHGELNPIPIEDEEKVDALRKEIGLQPLEKQTKDMRAQAIQSGEKLPVNYKEYKKRANDWAKSVGWRS